MREHAKSWLRSERVVWSSAALALLLTLPALGAGFQADDHIHAYEATYGQRPTDLFSIDAAEMARARTAGAFVWWSSPRLRIHFVRPLSSLWHTLDYRLWPSAAWFMHLESNLLYVLLVVVAALLYRHLSPDPLLAGLAALMFAIDDGHGGGVGWIATRNTLLATLFVLLALFAHACARETRRRRLQVLSALLVGLALLSAESGISALAYLGAYALVYEGGPWHRRLRTLLPQLSVASLWAIFYLASRAGLRGASWYRELDRPLELVIGGALDLPLWLCSLFGPSIISIGTVMPDSMPRLWGMLVSLLCLPPLILATPRNAQTRFFALGALACVPPLFTTVPQDRLLMGATFGAFGVIASFLQAAIASPRRWLRGAQRVFVALHFLLAPLGFLFSLNANEPIAAATRALVAAIPRPLPRQVILVNSPLELLSVYAIGQLATLEEPVTHALHQLYAGAADLSVARLDPNTLELHVPSGYARSVIERVFCAKADLPQVGDERVALDLRVRVEETNARGLPSRVQFRFPTPLESDQRIWLIWHGTRPERWNPPPIGHSVSLTSRSLLRSFAR